MQMSVLRRLLQSGFRQVSEEGRAVQMRLRQMRTCMGEQHRESFEMPQVREFEMERARQAVLMQDVRIQMESALFR